VAGRDDTLTERVPDPTEFLHRCPTVYLRKLTVHDRRLTTSDIIKFTLLPNIEYLEVEHCVTRKSMDSLTSSSGGYEPSTSTSALKNLKFSRSSLPTVPVFKLLLGHLTALESLHWVFSHIGPDPTMLRAAISSGLKHVSQTLVKLRLTAFFWNHRDTDVSQIDLTQYKALKELRILGQLLFGSEPDYDCRRGYGKPIYCRLPLSLENLEIC
jgi:hypothetical protein